MNSIPQRVAVTGLPRPTRVRRTALITTRTDGLARVHSLIRVQLRAGLRVCATVCGALVALPLVFALVPELGRALLLGIPLPWLVLGVLVYPALVFMAMRYVSVAERVERKFLAEMETDYTE